MVKMIGFSLTGLLLITLLRAQDTLPRFSAIARGPGKILISWHNTYPVVTQISIQRSADSLRNFTTLLTVPDPTLPANGVTDSKAPHPNFYYRLFIVLDNGKYLFTPSRRPGPASEGVVSTERSPARQQTAAENQKDEEDLALAKMAGTRILYIDPADKEKARVKGPTAIHTLPSVELSNTVYIRKGDNLIGQLTGSSRIQAFRDSLLKKTKDTLVFVDGDTLRIKPFIPKEEYRVSPYVYTGRLGNVHVSLPGAAQRHYAVRFYDDANKLLFELTDIRDASLILDKTNFHHAGWFRFELYDGDQLKEKNKLFIPKDF
ncbi:MAG: hypothetical protein JST42_01315 [Bacteroidetes bacterium]|nr:hypothetical protein [Bacteroidota bacterium]